MKNTSSLLSKLSLLFLPIVLILACTIPKSVEESELVIPVSTGIQITYSDDHYSEPVDGRLIVLIAQHLDTEPRFQLRDDSKTCQGFGMDVNEWRAGVAMPFASNAFGYPVRNMEDLPTGDYYVQALFHKYETFNLSLIHI